MNQDPPQDTQAEAAVLGGMLLSQDAISEVSSILKDGDFYRPANGLVFRAAVDLFADGKPVDAITVGELLSRRGQMQRVGGAPYLLDLIQSTPTATNAPYYAEIIAHKSRMRRIVETGIKWQQLGYADTTTPEEVDATIAEAERFLKEVQTAPSGDVDYTELISGWRDWVAQPEDFIATPWAELNSLLGGGMRRRKLYVAGGSPGSGKSLFGLNLLLYAAECELKVTAFSLEMGRNEVASRLLAAGAWANYGEIYRKRMERDTWDRVEEYLNTQKLDLTVVDKPSISVEQICAHIKRSKPAVAFVDYLQLVTASDKRAPRREQIDHITRSLKICAGENDCAIILASQLNRGPASNGRAPSMTDLKESSGIESDADVVALIDRSEPTVAKIRVVKHRDGRQGIVELVFRGHISRMGD